MASPLSKIKAFASKIGADLYEYQICVAHRLPIKGKIPPIMVKLNDYEKKTELIKVSTHFRRGSTEAQQGCLCSSSVNCAPTRDNFLMHCAD